MRYVLLILLCISIECFGQPRRPPSRNTTNQNVQSFFIEFGGPGQGVTLNFETRILGGGQFGPGIRIGGGIGSDEDIFDITDTEYKNNMFFVVPVGTNWIFALNNNQSDYIEIGTRILWYSRLPCHFYSSRMSNTKYPNDKFVLVIGGHYGATPINKFLFKVGGGLSMSRNRMFPYLNFGMGITIK
jgi:hypothetical protein